MRHTDTCHLSDDLLAFPFTRASPANIMQSSFSPPSQAQKGSFFIMDEDGDMGTLLTPLRHNCRVWGCFYHNPRLAASPGVCFGLISTENMAASPP